MTTTQRKFCRETITPCKAAQCLRLVRKAREQLAGGDAYTAELVYLVVGRFMFATI